MAKIENRDIFGPDVISKTTEDAKLLLKALDDLEKGFVDVAKAQQKIVNSEDQKTIQSVQKTTEAINELNKVEKASETIQKEKIKLQQAVQKERLAELKLQKDREKAFDKADKQEKVAIKNAQKLRKSTLDNANAFKILTKQTNEAQARFKRLAAQYGETDARTKKALVTFRKLDNKLRSINNTARDGRRDVGRYGLALQKVGASLRSGLGAAGLAIGVTAIAGAFRNTFNRIREFDKELQNIAGVTGVAREDLKSLEKAIISVAGTSIKTSNEVAQLASTLFTLGNSEKEVKLLLKPVNDLSIALGATSEEAADFLGQTLNAFGKGAESGQEFADIIANVRTSTSLDFQRIKDALGFVAPTANALGLSLGQVSAQIGVLQDNGIKAARAGRLLNTSFARLVKQGKSLDDALLEINQSQNKVVTATNLFGAESFTLGLILADNVDRTAELANEFDNLSDGSLKKLTDEQLKSLDAQFKILDSTWEKFILSLDSGNSAIGGITRTITGFLTETITGFQNLDLIAKSTFNGLINFRDEELSRTLDGGWVTETGVNINKIRQEFDKIPLGTIAKNVDKVRESWIDILGEDRTDAALLFTQYIRERTDAEKELSVETEINTKVEEGNTKAKSNNAKSTRELTGLIEKQSEVVKNLNEEIKRATTEEDILRLSIEFDVEQEELERLKRIVSSSFEEADKIERDLIEDATERRIAQEKEKSDKLIKQIETNSRIESDKKNDLIVQETERLENFELNEAIKKRKRIITQEADFARAEIEQRRTGFKTQEEFEKFKSEQFLAIKRNQLQAELDLLEFSNRDEDDLRKEQLKAQLEGLHDLGKGFEDLKGTISDVVQVIGEVIDEAFEKRILAIDEQLTKAGENVDRLTDKAREGRLAANESLAFEEKKEIELARLKEREQKRQEKTKALFAILSSFNANDGNLPKTIADISVLKALASGLTAFDGVDDTGSRGNIDSKGGKLWTLHPNEQVWSKKDRGDVGFRNRDEIKDIVGMYDNGFMMDALNHDSADFMNKGSFMLNGMSTGKIESKLDDINRGINGIVIPENHFDYDLIRNIFEHRVKKGNRTTIKHSKLF